MKSVKSFDLFEKITFDHINHNTCLGAITSLTAISLMIFLLVNEVMMYLTPHISKKSILYQDPTGGKIKAHFSIKFFNTPCAIISIDQEDLIGNHKMDIRDHIEKTRITHDDKKINGEFIPYKSDLMEKAIREGEKCLIKGYIEVNKVPGDFHFSFHQFRSVWEYLKNNMNSGVLFQQLKLNHQFFTLNFGDKELNDHLLSRFGVNEFTNGFIHNEISSNQFVEERNENVNYNFEYYVKLIPHLFKDEINKEEFIAYEYSLSHTMKPVDSEEEMPIVMVNYDISPITMQIVLERQSLARFLVRVCAIVGGVFVMFSIMNSLLLFLCFDLCEKEANEIR